MLDAYNERKKRRSGGPARWPAPRYAEADSRSPRSGRRSANKPKQRGTLRALGLRGIGETNMLPDRPEIRGMIARVPHLITVDGETDMKRRRTQPAPGSNRRQAAVGRGIGGKGGKTAGRGTKGQQRRAARSPAASRVARCR